MLREYDGRTFPVMVLIPARGGSKGIPCKALYDLGGKTLLSHTVEYARNVMGVDKVVVTTDHEEIRQEALENGAEAPFLRPATLSGDFSRLNQVYAHALRWYEENEHFVPRVLVTMLCTNPFRRPGLVDAAVAWGMEEQKFVGIHALVEVQNPLHNLFFAAEKGLEKVFPDRPLSTEPAFTFSGSFHVAFPGRDLCDRQGMCLPILRHGGLILDPLEAIDLDETKDVETVQRILAAGMPRMQAVTPGDPALRYVPDHLAPDSNIDPHCERSSCAPGCFAFEKRVV